jgi:hypothetical protein
LIEKYVLRATEEKLLRSANRTSGIWELAAERQPVVDSMKGALGGKVKAEITAAAYALVGGGQPPPFHR